MILKTPVLHLDKIVVGHSIEAVRYAYENNAALIVNGTTRPFGESYDEKGNRIKQEWLDLVFELGRRTQLPIPFDVEVVRLEEENLVVITRAGARIEMTFTELIVFDFEKTLGLNVKEEILSYRVYDLFEINHGALIKRDLKIDSDNKFLNKIVFYPSPRNLRNTDGQFKDIWVESQIAAEDLHNFDYSSTIVKLLLKRKLEELQIKSDTGRTLKFEHRIRQVYKKDVQYKVVSDIDERLKIGYNLINA